MLGQLIGSTVIARASCLRNKNWAQNRTVHLRAPPLPSPTSILNSIIKGRAGLQLYGHAITSERRYPWIVHSRVVKARAKSANIGRRNAGKDVARIRRSVCLDVYRQPGRFRNPDLLIGRVAVAFCAKTVEGRADAVDGLIAQEGADNLSLLIVLFPGRAIGCPGIPSRKQTRIAQLNCAARRKRIERSN
jgi:hypothetical protein